MKNIALLFIVNLLFLTCQKKEEKKSFWDDFYKTPYVISEKNRAIVEYHDSLAKLRGTDLILPPLYFGSDTFGRDYMSLNLLIHQNRIYQYFITFHYDYGLDTNKVIFQNLNPDRLQEVIHEEVIDLTLRFIKNHPLGQNSVAVSSYTDTLSAPFFTTIMDSLQKNTNYFVVRRITEEEHHVLDAKTKNIPYDPKNYTWTMNYVWLPFER